MIANETTKSSSARSISSVAFAVGGEQPFEKAVHIAASWMQSLNSAIPDEALKGSTFDIGGGGDHPARSVNFRSPDERIWSATIDNPDRTVLGRTWITELTVAESLGSVHFGTRLLNITRKSDEWFAPSIPRVVRDIINHLPCSAEGIGLSESPTFVQNDYDLDWLIGLLEHSKRKIPVIIVAEATSQRPLLNLETLAGRLCGAAHVVALTASQTKQFSRRVGRELAVYDGAVRLYRNELVLEDANPYSHPLWLNTESRKGLWSGIPIIARALSVGVSKGTTDYPRFDAVRQAVANHELHLRRSSTSATEMLSLYEEENQALREELTKLRSEQNQWLSDAEKERSAAESNASQLKAEVVYYRTQVASLREAISSSNPLEPKEPLLDLSDFESWIERNISRKIWFAPKAIREIEQNNQYSRPEDIGEALRILDDLYIPLKISRNHVDYETFKNKLRENNLQLSDCFANPGDLRRFPAYAVTYRAERHWCDQHLKRGGGTDPRSMFRIYFNWHAEAGVLLVGHLPTHLDNNLTN